MNTSRLKEPSTWSGLGTILAAIAPTLPGLLGAFVAGLAAACGAAAVRMREKGPAVPPATPAP